MDSAQVPSGNTVHLSVSAVVREFDLMAKEKKGVIRPLSVTIWRLISLHKTASTVSTMFRGPNTTLL